MYNVIGVNMKKDIEKYYNKFCEDKRLLSRHGQVEFAVTMHYIKKYLKKYTSPKVLDVGAGTGRYSFALKKLGCSVTAVELVKYNLGILKSKGEGVNAYQGDARNLKRFKDDSFDIVLLFGPMYHLLSREDKLAALNEAKRVVRQGGIIFISYLMTDYAIVVHGFKDGFIHESIKNNKVDEMFNVLSSEPDLYSYVRIEDVDNLKNLAGLERIEIVAQDGPSDYMRDVLNKMDDETFNLFIKYQITVSNKKELLGASSHVLDILKK